MRTLSIPFNSFLAIFDRVLRAQGLQPVYVWKIYWDTITRKNREGVFLLKVDGHSASFEEKSLPFLGVLGFVNGKEPGEGSIALQEVIPKKGDQLALAYVIEGVYRGDFDGTQNQERKNIAGFHLIHSHSTHEKDLEDKSYEIPIVETNEALLRK